MSYFTFKVLQVGVLIEPRVEVEKGASQQNCQFNISMKLYVASNKKNIIKVVETKKIKTVVLTWTCSRFTMKPRNLCVIHPWSQL